MCKLLLRCCLLFLLTVPLAAQNANWNIYTDSQGNFSVLFPEQPQDTVNSGDGTVKSHTLMARDGKAFFMVVYTIPSNPQTVDDATYQIFKNAVFKELPKCEVETEKAPTPALNGYIGHWYRLNCDMPGKVFIEGNLYWGKNYAYAVMAMWPDSIQRPTTEPKFLESFSVLTAAK